ncbi:MAG: dihydrolipoamide acetyltransferase family protein [Phycisphaerales bacterium]
MATEFKLPELGENIHQAQVVSVLVATGQTVAADQPVIEVETDKAVMEVPITVAGVIGAIRVAQGDMLKVGQVICTVEEGTAEGTKGPRDQGTEEKGSGTEGRRDEGKEAEPFPPSSLSPSVPPSLSSPPPSLSSPPSSLSSSVPQSLPQDRLPVFASPAVRKLAREIGVDITLVKGTDLGGRITEDDVKNHARSAPSIGVPGSALPGALPDFTPFGRIERVPMSMIAKKTAQHMATCWANVPHVTLHQDVDVTDLELFRKAAKAGIEKQGGKLTVTAILVKLVVEALKRHPIVNASFDAAKQELVYKKYFHLGVAVDTPRGLVVPVIRNADQKSLADIAKELNESAIKSRDSKLTLDDMSGGTFTITNLGGIGVGFFSPIVNWPEVAILGVGTAAMRMRPYNGQMHERLVMPLSLSFDHRVVNGADGAKFLTWLKQAVEQPLGALLG